LQHVIFGIDREVSGVGRAVLASRNLLMMTQWLRFVLHQSSVMTYNEVTEASHSVWEALLFAHRSSLS
jgi:hypothetical protein